MDKVAYVFGTSIIILYSYLIGKYPHTLIYDYVLLLLSGLLIHRYQSYAQNGYHMYLFDFCYVANFLLLALLSVAPKCQWLMVTVFVFSNGPLAAAIAAFRNSLVYHRVDMLTSLAIHAIPMTLSVHMRWFTVPEQEHLPAEQQQFAPFADTSSWGDFLDNFFLNPLLIYFIWLVGYGIVNFVLTKNVSNYKYDSSYKTFTTNPALVAKFSFLGLPLQLIFLMMHFVYYFVLHCFAVLLWHYFYLNMVVCVFWLVWSFFNGANFYMESFSKKYEKSIQKLDQLQKDVVSTPTLRRMSSSTSPK